MPSIQNWKPYTHHVQGGLREGNVVNSQFALICSGPPYFKMIADDPTNSALFPIGLTQNFSIGQSKNFSRIFEIGSDRAYFMAGRSVGQLGLGRVMFHGPSLLRVMYAYYDTKGQGGNAGYPIRPLIDVNNGPIAIPPFRAPSDVGETPINKFGHNVKIPPGYNNFFVNLASDLFSQPTGMLLVLKDSEENVYGSIYLEQCYIPSHSFGFDAQGLLISESNSLQYERMVPIETGSLELIRDVGTAGGDGRREDKYGGYGTEGTVL